VRDLHLHFSPSWIWGNTPAAPEGPAEPTSSEPVEPEEAPGPEPSSGPSIEEVCISRCPVLCPCAEREVLRSLSPQRALLVDLVLSGGWKLWAALVFIIGHVALAWACCARSAWRWCRPPAKIAGGRAVRSRISADGSARRSVSR
jgi:hypothetical protein